MITEEMMAAAAAEMNEAMLRSLPEPEDCYHEFSAKFEKKMKRVIYRADHPLQFRILQKVASIILVLFLGFATIMAISPTVRASVFGWIRECFDSFTSYYLQTEFKNSDNPNGYCLSTLTDDYTLIEEIDEDNSNYFAIYMDNAGDLLYFSYSTSPERANFFVENSAYTIEEVLVKNHPADLYISNLDNKSNSILWCNEESNTIFYITAMLGAEDLIHLAEGVVPK